MTGATAVVTGSGGLIGSESVRFFTGKGLNVVGIDNDMRCYFFGPNASTRSAQRGLVESLPTYIHEDADIRDVDAIQRVFQTYAGSIRLVIHTAAQPSHDWAVREPVTDFTINANGTLNLLEATRRYCPSAAFIFTSTNKVYGDRPNLLPLVEHDTRWEIDETHPFFAKGIDESMSIDGAKHSLFGASKLAADVMVQEYGKYFGMNTGVFRGGCLSGPGHAGAQLHGFLSYLMQCACLRKEYHVLGYKGKQVRDNIHSADMVSAFFEFYKSPKPGEVYNMGGSRYSNCSMHEAIHLCEDISGNRMNITYVDEPRSGDHIWWISDVSKFKSHYPTWNHTKDVADILREIYLTMSNNDMMRTAPNISARV